MNWWPFSRKQATPESKSLADPGLDYLAIFGALPTLAGTSITPRSAMRVPAVRCAVQTIAETIGQLPVHVFDANRERVTDHPIEQVLNRTANDWQSASVMKETLVRDALLYGDGLAAIVRVGGKPVELIRYLPGTVSINRDEYGGPVYEYGGGVLNRADVLHIMAPSIMGWRGDSVVQQARDAIALAILLEQHGAKLFANGARPAGTLEIPNDPGADAIKKIKAMWAATHDGGANAGKTAVLLDGAKFNPLTFSSVDAQYLELRKFAITEIARAFQIPSTFLGDLDRATWGNLETLNRQFLQMTLLPWIARFEGEIALKLIGADAPIQARFAVDGLLRADFSARFTGYSQAITARIMNPNEVRALENLPPYAGGEIYANPAVTPGAANSNTPTKGAA